MHYFAPLVQSQEWKLSDTKQANAGDEILAVFRLPEKMPHLSPPS